MASDGKRAQDLAPGLARRPAWFRDNAQRLDSFTR
jgi:hypothetical protein